MQTFTPLSQLTEQRLAELGVRISTDGFAPHEPAINDLIDAVRQSGVDVPAATVLADRNAPEVARSRALAAVSSAWPEVRAALQDRFDDSFGELLGAWTAHHDLRRSAADVADLADSRSELDQVRRNAAAARRGLATSA